MYEELWRLKLERSLADVHGWDGVLLDIEARGLFTHWRRVRDPGGFMDSNLGYALTVALGDFDHSYVAKFLGYAKQVSDRTSTELERWSEDGDWGNRKHIRANFLRHKAYIDAWTEGRTPDAALLSECAALMHYSALKEYKGTGLWSEPTQSEVLSAVQSALVAEDFEAARALLKIKKTFKYTQRMYDWTQRMAALVMDQSRDTFALNVVLREVFDRVRAPDWKFAKWTPEETGFVFIESMPILHIQLALLIFKYVQCRQPTWREVIGLIAE